MTIKEYAEEMFKKYGIEYTCFDELGNGCFRGERNGKGWTLNDTCSWDGYYQLSIDGGYLANRISIKTAVKKIIAM